MSAWLLWYYAIIAMSLSARTKIPLWVCYTCSHTAAIDNNNNDNNNIWFDWRNCRLRASVSFETWNFPLIRWRIRRLSYDVIIVANQIERTWIDPKLLGFNQSMYVLSAIIYVKSVAHSPPRRADCFAVVIFVLETISDRRTPHSVIARSDRLYGSC